MVDLAAHTFVDDTELLSIARIFFGGLRLNVIPFKILTWSEKLVENMFTLVDSCRSILVLET